MVHKWTPALAHIKDILGMNHKFCLIFHTLFLLGGLLCPITLLCRLKLYLAILTSSKHQYKVIHQPIITPNSVILDERRSGGHKTDIVMGKDLLAYTLTTGTGAILHRRKQAIIFQMMHEFPADGNPLHLIKVAFK
jgi:hypothetical protein